jgi:hypothetical protein
MRDAVEKSFRSGQFIAALIDGRAMEMEAMRAG